MILLETYVDTAGMLAVAGLALILVSWLIGGLMLQQHIKRLKRNIDAIFDEHTGAELSQPTTGSGGSKSPDKGNVPKRAGSKKTARTRS